MHRPHVSVGARMALLLASAGRGVGLIGDAAERAAEAARAFGSAYTRTTRAVRSTRRWRGHAVVTASTPPLAAARIERAIAKRARRGARRLHEVSMDALATAVRLESSHV